MNTGIIASRYAKALLKFTAESGTGKEVYSQVCVIFAHIGDTPQFRDYLVNVSDVSVEKKRQLMTASLGKPVHEDIMRFLNLVTEHHRLELFPRMLLSFVEQYRAENGIKVGKLVTAMPSDGLRERLESLCHDKTGAEVHLEEKVDSDIIGGFVFELDGYRIDASVDRQLRYLKRQLVDKNKRIV